MQIKMLFIQKRHGFAKPIWQKMNIFAEETGSCHLRQPEIRENRQT
jgi:hypothetical protein